MNEYLTREQLAERWGVAPTEIDAIEAAGIITDAAIVGPVQFLLAEILAVEDCGLHLDAILAAGGPIDARQAPEIFGDTAGTCVEFGW